MRSAGSQKVVKLIWVLLAVWTVFSLSGCMQRTCVQAGGSNVGKADSVASSRDEKNPGSSYRLVAHKEYRYGSGPGDFGIEHGVPPVACGGFSAGGAEGNLYVLDLVNRNVKVLRKTDAALLKVVKLPSEVMGEGLGFPWYIDIAADENGIIYMVAPEAGRARVVAFDDTGKILSVHPIPEEIGRKERHGLAKTREGQVVLCLADVDPEGVLYSFYSFKHGKFTERRYRIETRGDRKGVLELSRFESGSLTGLGRYSVAEGEEAIASAGFIGEDGSENAYVWVQVEKPPVRPENVRLGVLRFSREGKLLGSLFVPEGDYFATYGLKFFDVGRDGSIYQVIPAEVFLKVRVWALR